MEYSYESHSNGYVFEMPIQRHISYKSSVSLLQHFFDIRVFYARISNFLVDDSTPECLILYHIPLNPSTILEVNGMRSLSDSETSCLLRRDRMDRKFEEATFVSTDSIRTTGSIKFEVFDKDELLLTGNLEMSDAKSFIDESNHSNKKWSMNCESAIFACSGFLKGKQVVASDLSLPCIEVYVAGCFLGTPIILTKTLQLKHPKKERKAKLNIILEDETSEESYEDRQQDLQITEYKSDSDEEYNTVYWGGREYIEEGDGELSWFNAGVRVGVGIGLGICLGIGIGVGLFIRTYNTTTRTHRRRLV